MPLLMALQRQDLYATISSSAILQCEYFQNHVWAYRTAALRILH